MLLSHVFYEPHGRDVFQFLLRDYTRGNTVHQKKNTKDQMHGKVARQILLGRTFMIWMPLGVEFTESHTNLEKKSPH